MRRTSFAVSFGGLALALAAVVSPPPVAAIEKTEGLPPWRTGGRVGFTLDASTRPDSSGMTLEVSLRLPPATLARIERDTSGEGRLSAQIKVKGRYGSKTQEVSRLFVLEPEDSLRGQGKVIVMRFPASPGACRIEAKLTDLNSRKRGLLLGSDAHHESQLAGEFEVPKAQQGRDLSLLQFLWPSADVSAGAAFERDGRSLVPNPDRLYGLYAGELRAGFVARAKAGDERPWHWVARVFDGKGAGVAQRESTAAGGRMLDAEVTFDVSSEPGGLYELEVKAWQEGDATALQRRQRFSIGWQPDTWLRSAAETNDEVHFLLDADSEEKFALMHPGEQEAFLEDFWRRRDPTPDTATNEALENFRARIQQANANFTRAGFERGMFTDMGRVFVRYGVPNEILQQVIPAGESTLERELQQIMMAEDRQPVDVAQKGLGGDMRPFEVWIYEGDIPLPPDADPDKHLPLLARRRLLFLFVDDQGTGLYRLRYSTE